MRNPFSDQCEGVSNIYSRGILPSYGQYIELAMFPMIFDDMASYNKNELRTLAYTLFFRDVIVSEVSRSRKIQEIIVCHFPHK